ncbi:MAG: hypothetical protein EOM19_03365 [Candidatus Moranbacteria bacterium]|nr:hypothetical protein [Candidatus Moranbacteria bacterium]
MKIKKSIFLKSIFFLSALLFLGGDFSFANADTKWYPGHYIFIADANLEGMYSQVGDIPSIRGVQRSYYWDELEPTKDNYDFSKITNEANYLRERGWKMIIQIQTRTFGKGTQNQKIPAYLKTATYNYGAYYAESGASTVLYGDAKVFERFTLLLRAMGKALDSNNVIAGINMHESGISPPIKEHWLYPIWTTYKVRHGENILRIDQLGREVFPTTPFVQYYGAGSMPAGQFESLALKKGFGIGNPDTVLRGWYELKEDGSKILDSWKL